MTDVSDTIAERGQRYGDFTDHARISQSLQAAMHLSPNWPDLSDDKREALILIVHKIARILNGDPEYADNWHDIGGYAKLAEERCTYPDQGPAVSTVAPPVGWIPYSPGEIHPTDNAVAFFKLQNGQEYARAEQNQWDWSECGDGAIVAYKLVEKPLPKARK